MSIQSEKLEVEQFKKLLTGNGLELRTGHKSESADFTFLVVTGDTPEISHLEKYTKQHSYVYFIDESKRADYYNDDRFYGEGKTESDAWVSAYITFNSHRK